MFCLQCLKKKSKMAKTIFMFLGKFYHYISPKSFLDLCLWVKRGPMISPLSACQYVSMSVGKCVFSKTAHRIFLKLLMKLGCLKGKTEGAEFLVKVSYWGIMPENTPRIGCFLGFCKKKKKKIVLWCVDFLGLDHAPKPHGWEKSGSRFKCKNALGQSDCRIFKF